MPTHHSPADALNAYLALLKKNATGQVDFALKEHFAQELMTHLDAGAITPVSYRRAVDSMLGAMPPEYKKDAVQVARELFPFLTSDVKSVAAMMQTGGYRGFAEGNGAVTQNRIRTMPELIAVAGFHTYSTQHAAALEKYLACLRSRGLDESAAAMRGRIAKALLYMSRDKTVTPEQYRAAIDRIMPAITEEKARLFFVVVAREFFHFLTMNPDAPTGVNAAARYAGKDIFG